MFNGIRILTKIRILCFTG